jgi:hypothetical protein
MAVTTIWRTLRCCVGTTTTWQFINWACGSTPRRRPNVVHRLATYDRPSLTTVVMGRFTGERLSASKPTAGVIAECYDADKVTPLSRRQSAPDVRGLEQAVRITTVRGCSS